LDFLQSWVPPTRYAKKRCLTLKVQQNRLLHQEPKWGEIAPVTSSR
jgi:hypothetical protein